MDSAYLSDVKGGEVEVQVDDELTSRSSRRGIAEEVIRRRRGCNAPKKRARATHEATPSPLVVAADDASLPRRLLEAPSEASRPGDEDGDVHDASLPYSPPKDHLPQVAGSPKGSPQRKGTPRVHSAKDCSPRGGDVDGDDVAPGDTSSRWRLPPTWGSRWHGTLRLCSCRRRCRPGRSTPHCWPADTS